MEGTNFKNGVLVTEVDLDRSEAAKGSQILRTRYDLASRGVVSGGSITVNALNTDRVDIAAFSGYTPRGDYVSATAATNNVPLSSSVAGTRNYVLAIYTEILTGSKPHESNGLTYSTHINASYRIVVLTEAEYNNPSEISPSDNNLANNAVDRALLLGIVTATGGSLTAANIEGPIPFNNLLYTNPVDIPSMAGVNIQFVDVLTETGTGTLEYQYTLSGYQLRWASPGNVAGAWVNWTVDGEKTVTDASGRYISVYMAISQMSTTGTFPFVELIEIVDLYKQDVPRNTAEDWLHRKLRGTGIVSEKNPHGSSLNDLSGESLFLLDEHQDVMHCNGVWKGSTSTVLLPYVIPSSPYDTLGINVPATGDLYYINGKKLTDLDASSFAFTPATAGVVSSMWEVYATDEGGADVNKKMEYPPARLLRGTWIVNSSDNYPAGSYLLKVVVSGTSPLSFFFSWDGGPSVLIKEGSADQVIRLYSANGYQYIDIWVRTASSGITDAYLPSSPGTYQDSITVYDSPSWNDNLLLGNIPYWYDAVTLQTFVGYAPYSVARSVVDRRVFGNICADNISDSFLQDYIYHANDELSASGVLLERDSKGYHSFSYVNTTGFSVSVKGGSSYCRGKRLSSEDTVLTLLANKEFMTYVEAGTGSLQYLNITDDFAGSRLEALRYLVGDGSFRPNVSSDYTATAVYAGQGSPERGVPLHIFTTDSSSLDVTATIELVRNVNEVSDIWSVGSSFKTAFTSLEAAFLYANLYDGSCVEIKVLGDVVVKEEITQPSHVTVSGTSADASVSFANYGTWTPSNYVWRLSSGSIVKDLSISSTVSNVEYIFGINTKVSIQNCVISCTYDTFVFNGASVATVDSVRFVNNTVEAQGLVNPNTFSPSKADYWVVSGNTFYTSNTGFTVQYAGLVAGPFSNSTISNNTFFVEGKGSFVGGAISLYTSSNVSITGNTIEIDESSGSVEEPAIILKETTSVNISGNVVSRYSSSTTRAAIGVYAYDTSDITDLSITGNTFRGLHTGVLFEYDAALYNVSISSNNFREMYGSMVNVAAITCSGVSISNNTASDFRYSSSSLSSYPYIAGIRVAVGGVGSSVDGLVISGNNLSDFQSSDVSLGGILINCSSQCNTRSITINSNVFDSFEYTSSSKLPLYGISAAINGVNIYNVDISKNIFSGFFSTNYHVTMMNLLSNPSSGTKSTFTVEGNSIGYTIFNDTGADSVQSYGISLAGNSSAGKAVVQGNTINVKSSYVDTSSASYKPVALKLSGFLEFLLADNVIDYLDSGSYYALSGGGIVIEEALATGEIRGNSIKAHQWGITLNECNGVRVLSNKIQSSTSGIFASFNTGFVEVCDNDVALIPRADYPSAGLNNVPNGAWCIGVFSRGGFNISRNHTSTTDTVERIGGNLPTATYKAYHIIAEIGDSVSASVGRMYVVDNNYLDMVSQGTNSGNYSMSGIYFTVGAYYNSARTHAISVQGNTIVGGNYVGGSLPVLYNSANEPTVIYFADLPLPSAGTARYVISNNITHQTEVIGSSHVAVVSDYSSIFSLGTNTDAVLVAPW
jgi:hypothetical protein